MSSTYKSAMGKPVDMAAIRAKNENVRAVGNMRVNARGDIIDSNNEVVGQSSQRVSRSLNKPSAPSSKPAPVKEVKEVADSPTPSNLKQPSTLKPDTQIVSAPTPVEEPDVQFLEDMSEDEIEYFDDFDHVEPEPKTKKK